MNQLDKGGIKALLNKNNLFAKKNFGQNFLTNEKALNDIISTARITENDTIIEVGPGTGVLTQKLAEKAKKVLSIELDQTLIPLLQKTFENANNVEILNEDALKFTPPNTPYKLVANIPYYITSHLINHFLQTENKPISLTLLVQKEVAEKMVIVEPDMTILSLQVAIFGIAQYVHKVPAGYFFPRPKVDSAIIHIDIYKEDNANFIPHEKAMKILQIAKVAFSQRRKKLRNTLPKEYILNSKIDLNRRPETLSVHEWKEIIS